MMMIIIVTDPDLLSMAVDGIFKVLAIYSLPGAGGGTTGREKLRFMPSSDDYGPPTSSTTPPSPRFGREREPLQCKEVTFLLMIK